MKKLTKTKAAYIAGLIDGEGCISVSKTVTNTAAKGCKRGASYRSFVSVAMTNIKVLEWLQKSVAAGKIRNVNTSEAKNHKEAWAWILWSIQASDLLKQILPYMIVKKCHAQNLIRFQARMRQPGSKGLSDKEWEFREMCYAESKILNKRGRV